MDFETRIMHLTQDLLGSFDSRMRAVADIHANTQNEMAADQTARRAMSDEQQHKLQQHMDQLHTHMAEFRHAAQQQMDDTRSRHMAMATAQQQRMAQQAKARQQHTADFMAQIKVARVAMSQQQQEQLSQHMAQVRHANAAYMADTRSTRQQSTAQKLDELKNYIVSLQHAVDQLCKDTAQFMLLTADAHAAMAAEQREQLDSAQAQLATDVMAARNAFQAAQAATRADHVAARSEWARFNQAMTERRSG